MNKKAVVTGVILLGIMLTAVGLRFYDFTGYPPGLFPDEAANGEDALLVLEGDIRPFYDRGNGREGLFFYLQAASINMFGIGVWQLKVVSAVVGSLTVLAMYFAGKIWFGRLAGLLMALFLATSHWHVTLSRTGFRAILLPLFIAVFTALIGYTISSLKQKKTNLSYLYASLAGVVFAGGFYTYIAYRAMIGVVIGIVILLLLAALHPKIGFPHFKRYGKQLVAGIVMFVIFMIPIGWYFSQNTHELVDRVAQVSIFNPELQVEGGAWPTFWKVVRQTILAFFSGEGDTNWRHNVAGYPLLNPLVGFLFLLGLAWTIHWTVLVFFKLFKGEEIHLGMIFPYMLLLLISMMAPVISVAEGVPHGLRASGLIFPIFFLAGVAGAVVIHWIKLNVRVEKLLAISYGSVMGILIVMGGYDAALYLIVARNDAGAYEAYRGDLTVVAEYIDNHYEAERRPYLVLDTFSLQTVHFLLSVEAHDHDIHSDEEKHKYVAVDPATSHRKLIQPGEIIIFTLSTIPDADRYMEVYGEFIELKEAKYNRFGQEIMRVYQLREDIEIPVEGASLDA